MSVLNDNRSFDSDDGAEPTWWGLIAVLFGALICLALDLYEDNKAIVLTVGGVVIAAVVVGAFTTWVVTKLVLTAVMFVLIASWGFRKWLERMRMSDH